MMINRFLCVWLVGLFSLTFLISCSSKSKVLATQSDNSIIEIRKGSQAGECMGYCYSETIYVIGLETKTEKAWDDTITYPKITEAKVIGEEEWIQLINAVSLSDFHALDERIGCPDCTDGGACWVEIKTNEKMHKVSYDCGEVPESLIELVQLMKK